MAPLTVPTLDLEAQFREIAPDVRAAIERVLASQRFILGPEGETLERELAAYAGLAYGVAVSSGTDALLASLMALGVGPGDEVITTPYTFLATVTSIARLGARAAFVDIDPTTFNLDTRRVTRAITPRTRAIVPVHLFGQMADMVDIHAVARAHDLPVVEDAAQAVGARGPDGAPPGRGSRASTLSFFPSKNLGGMGDGGMVLTDDADVADRVRRLRNHGQEGRHTSTEIGGNFRLDELQAAILRAKLRHLDRWTDARRRLATRYRSLVADAGLAPMLAIPDDPAGARHVYNQLVARTAAGARDALRAFLAARGVATAVYYPVPMHLQPALASWGYHAGDYPEAERAAEETLALPLYPTLTDEAVAYVVTQIAAFFGTTGLAMSP